MELDTIIIGSGAGGLSAAICLSRAGQQVLVLEQHDVPGGWCHSFYLNGFRFTPGLHYIGLLDKGESTHELYEGLGIANDLVFFRMNPAAYEHCWIGDERINMPADFDKLYESIGNNYKYEDLEELGLFVDILYDENDDSFEIVTLGEDNYVFSYEDCFNVLYMMFYKQMPYLGY